MEGNACKNERKEMKCKENGRTWMHKWKENGRKCIHKWEENGMDRKCILYWTLVPAWEVNGIFFFKCWFRGHTGKPLHLHYIFNIFQLITCCYTLLRCSCKGRSEFLRNLPTFGAWAARSLAANGLLYSHEKFPDCREEQQWCIKYHDLSHVSSRMCWEI